MKQFSKLFLSLTLLFAVSTIIAATEEKSPSGSEKVSVPCKEAKEGKCILCNDGDDLKDGLCMGIPKPATQKATKVGESAPKADASSDSSSSTVTTLADCADFVYTGVILPRPQYLNSAALGTFMNPFLHGCDSNLCDTCFTGAIGYRYDRTRKPERLAVGLFGAQTLDFQGSLANARPLTGSIIADYFGLDPLYKGSVKFNPRIQQHNFDFGMCWELGSWADCLDCAWFGVAATLVHSKWALNAEVTNGTALSTINPLGCRTATVASTYPGYMNVPTSTSYATGVGYTPLKTLEEGLSGVGIAGILAPWSFGKFDLSKKGRTETKLANVDLVLGYDFARCADYHFGLFFKAIAPTGTKLDKEWAAYKFNNVIGNGHHWEIGGGLSAHWDAWKCDNQCFGIYLEGSVTTLLKNKQWRTFGFNGDKPLSEYMLLKEYTQNVDKTYTLKTDGPIMNAASYTTREIESSFKVQGDATLRLQYQNCGWLAAIGYNIYGRSKETFKKTDLTNELDKRFFAIKGVTGMAYFDTTAPAGWRINNASQTNEADIDAIYNTAGAAIQIRSDFDPASATVACQTPNIDGTPGTINNTTVTTWDGLSFVHPLAQPTLISSADINFVPTPRQIQHKIFGQLGYQWAECDWKPYFTLGGEYNFAKKCDLQTPINWGLWLQGGISF
jgi:hypothetical protein